MKVRIAGRYLLAGGLVFWTGVRSCYVKWLLAICLLLGACCENQVVAKERKFHLLDLCSKSL